MWERAFVGGGLPPMRARQSAHALTGPALSGASPLPQKPAVSFLQVEGVAQRSQGGFLDGFA